MELRHGRPLRVAISWFRGCILRTLMEPCGSSRPPLALPRLSASSTLRSRHDLARPEGTL